jgi:hypothetical protein
MAYIAIVPPIRFINIGSIVGPNADEPNNPDDVLIIRAFMIYLANHRKDLQFTTGAPLRTLVGKFDPQLNRLILDYKRKLSPLLPLPPEERGNGRVIPQDERFALSAAAQPSTTIMALNLEVRPLSGYGDTVVDVMCNLFPIRDILRGLPQGGVRRVIGQPDAYWRDLARNRIPWNQWTRAQQSSATDEYFGAVGLPPSPPPPPPGTRMQVPKPSVPSDRDNELFALIAPYREEAKRFLDRRTKTTLTISPNPSKLRDPVTLTVQVTTAGGQIPTGNVTIRFGNRQQLVIWGNLRLSKRPLDDLHVFTRQAPLVNGLARLIVPGEWIVWPGRHLAYAAYPDTGDLMGSETRDDIEQQVTVDGLPLQP